MGVSGTAAARWLMMVLLSAASLRAAWGAQAINIGIISDGKDDSALDSTLLQELVHNTSSGAGLPLVAVPKVVDRHDPLAAAQAVCSLLDEGVTAILDVSSTSRSSPAASLCEAHNVPCFFLKADRHSLNKHGEEKTSDDMETTATNFAINLQPSKDALANASHGVLREMRWPTVTLLYDTLDHLGFAEPLLTDPYFRVTVMKIQSRQDIDTALEALHQTGHSRVVVALRPPMLRKLVSVAPHHTAASRRPLRFFVATPDRSEAVLQELVQAGGTVTALRLGDSDEPQQAVFRDAKRVLVSALRAVSLDGPLIPEGDLCRQKRSWGQGRDLMDTMLASRVQGETGALTFSSDGARTGMQYGVLHLPQEGIRKLIRWPSAESSEAASGVDTSTGRHRAPRDLRMLTGGVVPTLHVSALLTEPFVMLKDQNITDYEDVQVGPEYEGFCIDLLDEIAAELDFEYTLTTPEDGIYGSYDAETDDWTGAIGDLVDQRVDVVIGDMSVTEEREVVVDFTEPWLNFGIGLLTYRGGSSTGNYWFLFLMPFGVDLWGVLIGVSIGVAVLLFLIARLSPYERNAPQSQEYQRWTPFTFGTSLWFALGTLFRQFVVVQPRAASTRFLTLVWWFFVVVVAAFYFANLVHFMNVRSLQSGAGVQSIYDLPNQRSIKYGAVYQGSTWAFFRDSESETLQRIFSGLQNDADLNRVSAGAEGADKVLSEEGSYAFFTEEPALEYIVERNCDLKQIGASVGSRSYAIALQQDSLYLDAFNDALFNMRESGQLKNLRDIWWKEKMGGGQCEPDDEYSSGADELSVDDLVGPLLILVVGVAVAIFIAVIECCCRAAYDATEKDSGLCNEAAVQLQQAVAGPPATPPSITVSA